MPTTRSRTVLSCATALLLAPAAAASAQAPASMTIPGLGTLSFPTSTRSAPAESAFVRGVLLLHVFEYERALADFRDAQRLDPTMAMAYWGEAMTYNHGVWDEQDPAAARAALAGLAPSPAGREAKAATPRERGYLHAVDILYGDGPKARRDTLYSQAMAELLRANPGDDEARAFYALSLLGLSQGVRNVPTYLRAAAIAESVFARNPRHPGAAHYWIHGMDDPEHAAQALPAARALSGIAPGAGHAQHMTAHIFMALGMWNDVVRANINAMRVVNAGRKARGLPPTFCGHYNFWLEYGYLELGKTAEARRLLDGCERQAAPVSGVQRDPDNSALWSGIMMWSRYVIDTEDWRGSVTTWTPVIGDAPGPRANWEFTQSFAAAQRHDLPTATKARARFEQARAAFLAQLSKDSEPDPGDAELGKQLQVQSLELQAAVALAAARPDSDLAVALLRRATAVEDSMAYAFGPPQVDKPSHELLGEVLLGLHRYADATQQFRRALARTPGRVQASRGLERAEAGAGGRR
ncbi:MAG TPA: hypothetical protein VF737_10350 [Gemmatimonadaceae bacterium]